MSEEHREALDCLISLVYPELKRIAHNRLRAECVHHTLSTTALVHEAYLKLADQTKIQGQNRAQFFAVASIAMRRILVDHARKQSTAKRGGNCLRVPLDADNLSVEEASDAILALNGALERLARVDERLCHVVECRFFGGLTEEETAAALGVTARTVERDWAKAKALLYEDLNA